MEINKVYNMDCLDFMKTLPNECIDLIVTDPPYNTGMDGTKQKSPTRLSGMFNDNYTDEEYFNLVNGVNTELFRILKNNKPIYIYIYKLEDVRVMDGKFKNTLIGYKKCNSLG